MAKAENTGADKAPKENTGADKAYKVQAEFRSIHNFDQVYKVGDVFSEVTDKERVENLLKKGLIK